MNKRISTAAFKLLFLVISSCGIFEIQAQFKSKTVIDFSDTVVLDSLPIAASSLRVVHKNRELLPQIDYRFCRNHTALLITNPEKYDTLFIQYLTFPDWLFMAKKHRSPDVLNYSVNEEYNDPQNNANSGNDVVTDGVLLRGISFGNAQDLVLNSSLNLRMRGKVAKDIEIEGAVTDQEFPFQPEGTTTTLQDFDRIYVALHMPHISVLLGDYLFQSTSASRFMKYSKKNRGLQLLGKDTVKKAIINWEATAALARGRFSRNEINGIEGLQGPYKLIGARGEQFVIVVSGTEVVYLDGKKLERGLQSDYVMDYNTGEVTFTPRHIITAFSRIVVEFQYSDRFYTRSVLGGNATIRKNKFTYFTGIYSEQDAKNQPIQQDLEAFDSSQNLSVREILAQAGDDPTLAQLSGERKLIQFSNTEPNYIRRDTGGNVFFEFVNQADTHQVFYRVNFTYVGPGKGQYVLTGSASNGKVYKFVGLISGIPAGDYEAVTLIQSPNRLRMAEAGVQYRPRKETVINTNVSVSNNDRNLFSAIGDKNNSGISGYLSINDKRNLGGKDTLNQWYLSNSIQLEQTSKNFVSIERYRDVEFGRQWSRNLFNPENGLNPRNSGFGLGQIEVGKGSRFSLYVKAGVNRSSHLRANTMVTGMKYRYRNLYLMPLYELGYSTSGETSNNFNRKEVQTGYETKALKWNVTGKTEESKFSTSLIENATQSYGLRELSSRLEGSIRSLGWSINAAHRINQNVKGVLVDAVAVRNAGFESIVSSKKYGYFRFSINYRNMKLLDTFFKQLYSNEDHIAGRIEYNFSKLFRYFSGNMYYQSISGREQQRQYSYFEVPAGQGFYTWVDYNGNGVKEVNEFEESPFKDQGKYIRLLVPTGNYIKAQGTEFNGNIQFQSVKRNEVKPQSRFGNKVTWNYNGKSTEKDWWKRILPFTSDNIVPELLAAQSFIRNLAEFESRSKTWLFQHNWQKRGSKIFFTNGFDLRQSQSHQIFIRYIAGSAWQMRLGFEKKNSSYVSEFVPANSYNYNMLGTEEHITYQPGTRFRISVFGKTGNYQTGAIKAAQLLEGGVQWNKTLGKGSMLETKASILQAQYMLAKATPLAFDILQGFSAGRNFRGIIDLRFNATKNIQMVMSYEGRKSADSKLVHVGRAEARYLF